MQLYATWMQAPSEARRGRWNLQGRSYRWLWVTLYPLVLGTKPGALEEQQGLLIAEPALHLLSIMLLLLNLHLYVFIFVCAVLGVQHVPGVQVEDSLQELVLSFNRMGSGIELRLSNFEESASFAISTISLALK